MILFWASSVPGCSAAALCGLRLMTPALCVCCVSSGRQGGVGWRPYAAKVRPEGMAEQVARLDLASHGFCVKCRSPISHFWMCTSQQAVAQCRAFCQSLPPYLLTCKTEACLEGGGPGYNLWADQLSIILDTTDASCVARSSSIHPLVCTAGGLEGYDASSAWQDFLGLQRAQASTRVASIGHIVEMQPAC